MIDKATIETIFETARIEEVVGDFVSLKKRGVNLLGLCPFHNEKTPSFTVSPAKGIYKCFGCGAGGNSVNFIMELESYSYPEALRYLAKKYHIEIPETEASPEQLEEQNEKESLLVVSSFAQKFFTQQLQETEEGKAIGLSYFKERGFSLPTIEKFQLGYCPDEWDSMTKAAVQQGYKEEYLVKTGLSIAKDEGGFFDRFRARVMFPIHNLSGRVIGFGGRTLKTDKKVAKYVNSPESDIYHKSKVLYGLYFAKKAVIANDNCYLVEGYTDVISLHQAGIENVVASSGTSLTQEQVRLIKRYTPNITILYDGDPAGIKASFRGIDLILEEGMNVKVALFPDNDDPDSYARKVGGEAMKEFIAANAKDFISFKASILLEDVKGDPVKKAQLIKDIVASIAIIPDGIVRSVYVKECSRLMDISEQVLLNELNKSRRDNYTKQTRSELPEEPPVFTSLGQEEKAEPATRNSEHQERDLIRLLLNYAASEILLDGEDEEGKTLKYKISVAHFVVEELQADGLLPENAAYRKILEAYFDKEADALPKANYFTDHEDKEISAAAISILATPYSLSAGWEVKGIFVETEDKLLKKAVMEAVFSLKCRKVEQMINSKQDELKASTDEADQSILLQEIMALNEVKKSISEQLGRVIL